MVSNAPFKRNVCVVATPWTEDDVMTDRPADGPTDEGDPGAVEFVPAVGGCTS